MTNLLPEAVETFGFISDVLANYGEQTDNAALKNIFQWASNASQVYGQELENDPVKAGAELIVGLTALAVAGPLLTEGAAVSTLTAIFVEYGGVSVPIAQSMAMASVGYLVQKEAVSLYDAVSDTLNSIVSQLGGSMSSVSSQATAGGTITSSATFDPNLIIASTDASGNTNQLLFNLPTPTQDAGVVAVNTTAGTVTAPSTTTPTDSSTGSTITFVGNDNQVHTATVLYQTDISYVVDPSSGYLAVGKSLVTGVTPPAEGSNQESIVTQMSASSNGDGSSINFVQGNGTSITSSDNSLDNSGNFLETVSTNADGSIATSFYDPSQGDAQTEEKFLNPDGSYSDTQFNLGSGSWASDTSGYNPSDQLTESVLVNKDNTTDITSFSLANASQRQDIYDPNGNLTGSELDATDGSKDVLVYNTDGGSVYATETDYDPTGDVTQTFLINKDGSFLQTTYVDGQPASTQYSVAGGELTNGLDASPTGTIGTPPSDFDKYTAEVADAVATQILQLVLKNDLPGSLLASAGAVTIIGTLEQYGLAFDPTAPGFTVHTSAGDITATEGQLFLAAFGEALAGGVGGYLGSEFGAEFFKAIGLPPEVGSLAGGVLGAAGAVDLAENVADSILETQTADFVGSLADIGAGAVGAFLGSELSQLVIGSGNEGSEIGGAVGAVAGGIIGSVIPGIGTIIGSFVGDFIGSLLGDIFGGLFGGHPSVGPNAGAQINFDTATNTFVLGSYGEDNGGDVQIGIDMAQSAYTALNAVISSIGGTVLEGPTGYPNYGFGYFKGLFYAADEVNDPNMYQTNQFAAASDAVSDGVFRILRGLQFQGGNQYMELALTVSNATDLGDLINDLNAAYAYSVYITNPLAFDVALAKNGDPTAYQAWLNQLTRIQALGLDQYSHGTLAMASPTTILTPTVSTVVVNGNVAGGDTITPAAGGAFTIEMAAGLTINNMWFSESGSDLVIHFDSGHTTTIQNWSSNGTLLQAIVFATDGSAIGSDVVATYIANDMGAANLISGSGSTNGLSVIGEASNFLGDGGNDKLVMASNGQIAVYEYDSNNHIVGRNWLTVAGTSNAIQMTAAQFATLSSINAPSGGLTIEAVGSGTFDLSSLTVTGNFNLSATNTISNVTLIGNDQNDQTLWGGTGTDNTLATGNTLTTGTGTGDIVYSYGTGDVVNLNGANGTANVSGGGGSWTNVNADGDTVNDSGAGDTIEANASGQVLNATGNSQSVDFYNTATNSTATISGDSTWASMEANNDTLTTTSTSSNSNITADGTGENITIAGDSNAVTTNSNGDTVNITGTNSWANIEGNSTTVSFTDANGGDASSIIVDGNSNSVTANGNDNGDYVALNGTSDGLTINGSSLWVDVNGTNDTVTASGEGSTLNIEGNGGNTVNITGANTWVNLDGNSNSVALTDADGSGGTSIIVNGNSNSVTVSGNDNGDYVALNGASDTLTIHGSNLWVDVNGNGDTLTDPGTGNTININGTSDTVSGGDDWFTLADGVGAQIGGGEDSYYNFGSSFATTTINNLANGTETTANGGINFGSGITDEDLWFKKSGNNLVVELLDTTDTITIDNWYGSNAGAQVQSFQDGNGLTLDSQIAQLVSAMATYSSQHTGFNPQTATAMPTDSTLQSAIAAAWHA